MEVRIPEVVEDARLLVTRAFHLLHQRYSVGPLSNRLFFHNTDHTYGVVERATKIAQTLRLGERGIALVQIAAAFHDTIQKWSIRIENDGVRFRHRYAGSNEATSAAEAVQQMEESQTGFTPTECGLVASAIIATIPNWDTDHATVKQSLLMSHSHSVIRAVAMADIGAAGMDPDCFAHEGYLLFAEEQVDIMRAIESARVPSEIHPEKQEQYRKRLLNWLESQISFARGRRSLFQYELGSLDQGKRSDLHGIFTYFLESIRRARDNLHAAESMSFGELMRQLDPKAFPGMD